MSTLPIVDDPTRDYGDKVAAVEPGGVEFIPYDERHGSPLQLLWTWTSPNMEFATVGVGIIGPLFFGLSFWESFWAIVLGTALGSGTQGVLSTWGPKQGLPQMVISRSAFGFFGNILPAGINSVVAGVGWFAVNSVSGALALHSLINGMPKGLCLVIVVAAELLLAFFGHNLVQAFERYAFPALALIFVVASIWVLTKAHPDAHHSTIPGGWLILVGAAFGYAAGWNPYSADYSRYLPADVSSKAVAWWSALGVFWSCVLLGLIIGVSAFDASYSTSTPLPVSLLPYLTHAVGAILLLMAGTLIARFLSRSVLISAVNAQLQYARILSLGVKWLVLVLTAAMVLDHLEIGGAIVALAFGILFGGIVLTLSLAVGLGSRDIVSRSLESHVDRGNVTPIIPTNPPGETFRHF